MSGSEVQVPMGTFNQPPGHGRRFVSAIIVEHQMHVFARGDFLRDMGFDVLEEREELCGSMPAIAFSQNLPFLDIQGGKERDVPCRKYSGV